MSKVTFRVMLPATIVTLSLLLSSFSVRAQSQCTERDQELIASFTQCYATALLGGSCPELLILGERLNREISLSCQAAIAQAQRQPSWEPSYPPGAASPPGNVIEHGGGVISVPGWAACGPTGCIPLN